MTENWTANRLGKQHGKHSPKGCWLRRHRADQSITPNEEPRLKIRIFALAKELDIDSKLLIDHCAKAGITIKNSALASISPDERDRVMDVIRSISKPQPAVQAQGFAPVVREQSPDVAGKTRTIRNMMAARSQTGRPPVGDVSSVLSTAAESSLQSPDSEAATAGDSEAVLSKTEDQSLDSPEDSSVVGITEPPNAEGLDGIAVAPSAPLHPESPPEVRAPSIKPGYMPQAGLVPRAMRSMSMTARSFGASQTGAPKKART